jgi:hypothetical protein
MSDKPLWNSARGADMSSLAGVFMVHLFSFIHGCRNRWREGCSVGAWREFISWVQVQVLCERIS